MSVRPSFHTPWSPRASGTLAAALAAGLGFYPGGLRAEDAAPRRVALQIDASKVLHRIDENVYGHFLEHIYHSVNGGLWGELVWNRSFEHNDAGAWRIDGGAVIQESRATNQRFVFGDPSWGDYEFSLRARKTGGAEGFLILFRVKGPNEFYWCNLGGWGNARHAIERGLAGGRRWGVVGPSIPGSIETGKWYEIRVRCEGRRFRIWLDGNPLIDYTDDERAHLAGRVGVGTWSTTAEFRDFKVASLEGATLYEGEPAALAAEPAVARHWKAWGEAKVVLERGGAANGAFAQRIAVPESPGAAGGLAQSGFAIAARETYAGSLWARGSGASSLEASLVDGEGRTLARQVLGVPGPSWAEIPIRLEPKEGAGSAELRIASSGGEVWIDQVSLMPRSWREAGGFRPDLLEAIAALRPPVIRWPGGCFASAYRWKDGIGPQSARKSYPIEIWDDVDVNSFGTDEFIAMCRRVGAEPLVVVNIGTEVWNPGADEDEFLQDVLDWIEYANGPADSKYGRLRAANGHPEPYRVRYWEIDNETWQMGAERYAAAVRKFAPAMRKADPSIRLAACGSGGFGRDALAWNRVLVERCAELIDYLSIHHYENPNRFAEGPRAYERFFRETAAVIAGSKNPRLKLYVSEWNAQSTDWRTGLYAGGLLNAFERSGDAVGMAGPALFLRHVSATAWDNAFVNFDSRRWFPAPNYVVMKLWRERFAPELLALEGSAEPLDAVATRAAGGKALHLKAVNPSTEPVEVEVSVAGGFVPARASLELVAPGSLNARNTLEEPWAVRAESVPTAPEGSAVRFRMPPISAGVLTLEK